MEPTIKDGTKIEIDLNAYLSAVPQRGDIIVFKDDNGSVIIKRVVALPGEEVEIKDSSLAYYTTYPNKSLEIARQLIWQHGKPEKVSLESIGGFADARLFFQDGFQALLGGFAVGYSGTRPDSLRAMLQAAGFHVTEEDIEKMSLPVHFTRQIEKE